jgi:MoaA/NifB/PqqE/SkfB family radical SAM enzyme/ubiquinone/menaquinone biosynthesis C-methylase UbiE
MYLEQNMVLHAPKLSTNQRNGLISVVDPSGPNWMVTDARGAKIMSWVDGHRTVAELSERYRQEFGGEPEKAKLHVDRFLRAASRRGFISQSPFEPVPYAGRGSYLGAERLNELWLHVNDFCNLACAHCLVSSGPDGAKGPPLAFLVDAATQAKELGVQTFSLTGGEPFARPDLPELVGRLHDMGGVVTILTNGTILEKALKKGFPIDPEKTRLQISLDGSTPAINDPLRGTGSFPRILEGIDAAVKAGASVTVSCVAAPSNLEDVPNVLKLVAERGIKTFHMLWLHRRGRAEESGMGEELSSEKLIQVLDKVRAEARKHGVTLDNDEAMRRRLQSPRNTRFDLSDAAYGTLCVAADGKVYPSAAFANEPDLVCGDMRTNNLAAIWREGALPKKIRNATVIRKADSATDPLRFLTGGGDIEHSYFFSRNLTGRGDFQGPDPYIDVQRDLILSNMFSLGEEARARFNTRTGFDAPQVFSAMGEDVSSCGLEDIPLYGNAVSTVASNCRLTDVVNNARKKVKDFYTKAGETPQVDLCCPISYDKSDTAHIPQSVLDRFYGCGSPMSMSNIVEGETVVDLGSGAGIDVFIAAKKVGKTGKAIGVDMTDAMRDVAIVSKPEVAKNLGYDVVDFRKGVLEDVPVESGTVDLVTSNCVVNLSPDKRKVFAEIWRILKDHGRTVISDIVSEKEVPTFVMQDQVRWGECIGGALSEEEFIAEMERAGFYGISIIKKIFWKRVGDTDFYSVTARGFKFEKTAGCTYIGQFATYLGPFTSCTDEEGHFFPRGIAVEVCTDTAAKLQNAPFAGLFAISEGKPKNYSGDPNNPANGCGPGCC